MINESSYVPAEVWAELESLRRRVAELEAAAHAEPVVVACPEPSERNAEAALKASEERFRAIYHHVNDAIFIHDRDTGQVVDVNARMCQLYECTREEALHSPPERFSLNESP